MSAAALVAGVDSSTQSCTVVLRSAETGELVHTACRPHPPTSPPRSEQHPIAWWTALVDAFGDIPAVLKVRVSAISVCAQAHGLVLLDARLQVVRPAKLWNDTTSAADARGLLERLPAVEWARRAGSVPPPAFTISKVAWMAANEPDSLSQARHLLVPGDWLTFMLTGDLTTDTSNASGTGYFSPALRRWDSGLLSLLDQRRDWESMLPRIVAPNESPAPLARGAARALGLRPGIAVGPGAADTQATAVAMDVLPGDVLVSLGTSGVVCARSAQPVADPTGRVNGNASATGDYLPVVCTLNATRVTDALARVLGVDLDELAGLALRAEPVDERPLLVPFLDGERVPDRPDSSGILVGLTANVTREQVAAAAFEGVVAGLVTGMHVIRELGIDVGGRVAITGGGARSAAYRQTLADLTSRPVHVVKLEDSAAAGSAVQAAAVLGGRPVADQAALWSPRWIVANSPRDVGAEHLLERFAHATALVGPDERTP